MVRGRRIKLRYAHQGGRSPPRNRHPRQPDGLGTGFLHPVPVEHVSQEFRPVRDPGGRRVPHGQKSFPQGKKSEAAARECAAAGQTRQTTLTATKGHERHFRTFEPCTDQSLRAGAAAAHVRGIRRRDSSRFCSSLSSATDRSTREAQNAGLTTHTMEVLQRVDGLFSSLKDAETGQRGFLLTSREDYLEPYNVARANNPRASCRSCAVSPRIRPANRNCSASGSTTPWRS